MSESIWWPDLPWWERKVLPLGLITLSFRQLGTISLAFLAAFIVSLPFSFPIAGFSFGGRTAVFCIVFGIGYTISSRRVKLLPIELQAFYILRTTALTSARAILRHQLTRWKETKLKKSSDKGERKKSLALEQPMTVEDFKDPVPLAISDCVKKKQIQNETRILLFLDEQVRGEDVVSPQKARYRLVYVPLPEDVGKHKLTAKLEGSPKPLAIINLTIEGRGRRTSEDVESITRAEMTQ